MDKATKNKGFITEKNENIPSSDINVKIDMEMVGFSASLDRKSHSSGSRKTSNLNEEIELKDVSIERSLPTSDFDAIKGKENDENSSKEIQKMKKHGAQQSKSAPVSRQQTILDEVDKKTNYVAPSSPVTKAIFTKLETKTKRKKRKKGVFGSVDMTSASTSRGKHTSQSSSEIGLRSKIKKKKRKGKKHKKSKNKKGMEPSILEYLKKENKNLESDTEDDDDDEVEISTLQTKRKIYRPHLGLPGQSFLRAQLEDPITLVEEEFLPDGLQSLRLTRRQLAMNFLYGNNNNKLRSGIKEPSEKSVTLDEIRSRSAQGSVISQDIISSARSLATSVTPNLLKTAPLRPNYKAVRFTIPMDFRVLESLTPYDYLLNYCIPESYFHNICSRVFENIDKTEFSNFKFLIKSFSEIFGYNISEANLQKIIDLIGLDDKIKENLQLFTAYAAILMRIQCHELGSNSQADKIEKMDFYLLRLNLKSFPINSRTNQLLQFLDSI